MRLVEQRCQLEVRGKLAVDVGDGALELPPDLGILLLEEPGEAHAPMLP